MHTRTYRLMKVQGNILFNFKITGNTIGFRESTFSKTCQDFVDYVTSNQDMINFIENTAEHDNSTLSMPGTEEFKPRFIYSQHSLHASDSYLHAPHASRPLQLDIHITNFMLFMHTIGKNYIEPKPKRSIMPTPDELLKFLNGGKITY